MIRRLLTGLTLGSLLLPLAGGCALTPPANPNPAQVEAGTRFAGTWETTYGRLTLLADGVRVTGNYGGTGRIEGLISEDGQTVNGTWAEPPNLAGRVTLTLSTDGKQLNGRWLDRGGVGQTTDWVGTRPGT